MTPREIMIDLFTNHGWEKKLKDAGFVKESRDVGCASPYIWWCYSSPGVEVVVRLTGSVSFLGGRSVSKRDDVEAIRLAAELKLKFWEKANEQA